MVKKIGIHYLFQLKNFLSNFFANVFELSRCQVKSRYIHKYHFSFYIAPNGISISTNLFIGGIEKIHFLDEKSRERISALRNFSGGGEARSTMGGLVRGVAACGDPGG